MRDYLPQPLPSQLTISPSPQHKRKFDGVDVNEEDGTTENGRGGESCSELHEVSPRINVAALRQMNLLHLHLGKKTLIDQVVETSVAAGINAISLISTSCTGEASQTNPPASLTRSPDMPRLQRRADIASGWKYWGPTGVAAIAAATAANRQRCAEECAERKLNPPAMQPRSSEPHVKRDFSSTFRLSDMKVEARKQTKKFREQFLATDSEGHDYDTTMSGSSHNSSSNSNSNSNNGAFSTIDSYIPTNPYARHSASAVKMNTGSAGSESPDATSSAAAASATNGTATEAALAVEAAASRRLAHDPTMLFQRKTEFSLMYYHRERILAGAAAEEGTGDDTTLAEPEVTSTGTTTGDTGNVFHHLRSDIYGIPYTKTTCTVNG